ncbi:DUF481 domain-containing protein [Glaciecola sp. XM2]|uniref:DUF481 domain-containing protein n=1 Tax=Glaciecola sp. XM2 TaxID=1914931 RepID=UPI001BDF29AD|nr:DUF481 domain-containing protein [Glaciecola sp. XM2]MBT1451471.1 DUF481 domain-containing protein [Glaciecola sp. XM2]
MTISFRQLSILPLIMLPSAGYCIIPVDQLHVTPIGFSGQAGLSLTGERGNKDEQEYNINGILRYGWDKSALMLLSDYNYTKTNDERNEDDLYVHLRYIQNDYFKQNVDAEVFVQYQYDDFADLSNRRLFGAGMRWRFAESSGEQTNDDGTQSNAYETIFGAGAFYEEEDAQSNGLQETTVRANLYGRFLFTSNSEHEFSVYSTIYVQPSVEQLDDVRSLLVGGIEFPIAESLALSLEAEVRYDSEPFEGVENTNVEYGVRISYSF